MKLMYKRKNLNIIVMFTSSLFFTLCAAIFLLSDSVYAENSSHTKYEKKADNIKKEESSLVNKKAAGMKPSQAKQKSNFIPSEKITADSSVPFPVDI